MFLLTIEAVHFTYSLEFSEYFTKIFIMGRYCIQMRLRKSQMGNKLRNKISIAFAALDNAWIFFKLLRPCQQ